MPESTPTYLVNIQPTAAELKLIARLRQIGGFALVDSDSMTVWRCGPPEHCNGHAPRQPQTVEEMIIAARNL